MGKPINILHNMLKRALEAQNPYKDVTGAQGRIIHFILKKGGQVFSKDIEREFNMQRATASDYFYLMEKNGMITREAVDGDRRLKKIVLTDKARQVDERLRQNIRHTESILAAGLTREDIDEFFRITDIMIKNMAEEF